MNSKKIERGKNEGNKYDDECIESMLNGKKIFVSQNG
ncbi:MAG: hypothetical protein ACI8RD_001978 [Bacillariaceae sp.]|jgi:hypothetical protein